MARCAKCGTVLISGLGHACPGYNVYGPEALRRANEEVQELNRATLTSGSTLGGREQHRKVQALLQEIARQRDKDQEEMVKDPWELVLRREAMEMATASKAGYLTRLMVRHQVTERRLNEIERIILNGDWTQRLGLYLLVTHPEIGGVALGYEEPEEEEVKA